MALHCIWIMLLLQVTVVNQNKLEIELYQDSIVSRPRGDVKLICKTNYISLMDANVIRWYIHDTMVPLYTFSRDPEINKIEDPCVLDAGTISTHGVILSELLLHINISDTNVYRCDIVTLDGNHCKSKLKVKFDDPLINFTYQEILSGRTAESGVSAFVNLTCHTRFTDGIPKYRIWHEHQPIMHSEMNKTYFKANDMGYFYTSTWSQLIILRDTGLVTCVVQDKRGLYTAELNITLLHNESSNRGMRHTKEGHMSNVTRHLKIVSISALLIILALIGSLVGVLRIVRKLRKRLSAYQLQNKHVPCLWIFTENRSGIEQGGDEDCSLSPLRNVPIDSTVSVQNIPSNSDIRLVRGSLEDEASQITQPKHICHQITCF